MQQGILASMAKNLQTLDREIDLSFQDLRKLFRVSEEEMKEYYKEEIQNFGIAQYSEPNRHSKTFGRLQSCYHENAGTEASHQTNNGWSKESNVSSNAERSSRGVKQIFENTTFNLELTSSEKEDCRPACPESATGEEETKDSTISKSGRFAAVYSSLTLAQAYQKKSDVGSDLIKRRSIFQLVNVNRCFAAWSKRARAPKISLRKHITNDLNEHKNQSIRVEFGRACFHCHKMVLRKARHFRESEKEVYSFESSEDGVTSVGFSLLYRFAMGESPPIQPKYLVDVRNAAQELGVPDLEVYCLKLLDSGVYQEDAAFEVFKAAKAHQDTQLQRLMLQRINKYFLPLVATRDFLRLDTDDICELLQSDTIGVNSEIEVFFAAIHWLNSKWRERSESIAKAVMSCVRFALMPPWFIYTLKSGTGAFEVDRVVAYKDVLRIIDDGASLAATISLFLMDNSKFEYIVQRLQKKIPQQRHWIYHKKCTYHFGAHEKVSEAVDYTVFREYLELLEIEGKNHWCSFQEGKSDHFIKIFCQQFLETTWSKVHL